MKNFSFASIPILIFTLLLFFACHEESCVPEQDHREIQLDQDIIGTWLAFERGFSPGGGYIIEEIDPDPPMTFTFGSERQFSTTFEGSEKYKFYLILNDPLTEGGKILALFETDPGKTEPEIDGLSHSYSIKWENNNLTLYYRWCVEGCHTSFRKVEDPE